ncbi:uncharacterized protein LOC131149200 [Malania oleifera]|uniref:uncharacterized protein LOC131149200 n=1 Tax=Malania oleifera TaxID=397392 RepID=UPI0025ADA1B8|nr:uncharacterized protein LOC131149200 [Malania oleifera]
MAIEKNNFKVSRFDSEFSPGSRESMSSDEDELQRRSSAVESDDDDEFDDADSGAGSDDFDLLELGETGAEFCQVGNQSCSVPFELYDLPDLQDILSLDVWNDCLTEEERFSLAQYLPDMDQHSFMHTLKELFSGCNFHFGSPITKLFEMLKGGFCEPRVALYRQALNYFQRRQHNHLLRKHQNSMVGNLCQIRDAWQNCKGYSIEERLRVLNIVRSQKSLMYEKMEDLGMESGSSEREESGDVLWSKRLKDKKLAQKFGRNSVYKVSPTLDFPSRGKSVSLEPEKYGKQNPKGLLKLAGSKAPSMKELPGRFPSGHHSLEMKPGPYSSTLPVPRQNKAAGYDSGTAFRMRDQMRSYDDVEGTMYEVPVHNVSRGNASDKAGVLKLGKREHSRGEDLTSNSSVGLPSTMNDVLALADRKRNASSMPEKKTLTGKLSSSRSSYDYAKKVKFPETLQQSVEDQMVSARGRHSLLKGSRVDLSDGAEPFWHGKTQGEAFSSDQSFKYDDWNAKTKKWKTGRESPDLKLKSYRTSSPQINDRFFHSEPKLSQENLRGNSTQNRGVDVTVPKGIKMSAKNEETESDSSEPGYEEEDDNPLMRSKLGPPSSFSEGRRSSSAKSGLDAKKAKSGNKDKRESARALDGVMPSRRMDDLGDQMHLPETEKYSSKAKQKGKMRDGSHFHKSASRVMEESYFSGSGKLNDNGERKKTYKLGKNGQLHGDAGERLQMPMPVYPTDRRQRGEVSHEHSVRRSNYLRDYIVDEEDDSLSLETRLLADDNGVSGRLGKKGQNIEAYVNDRHDKSDVPLLGCNTVKKKRKVKEVSYKDRGDEYGSLQSNSHLEVDESSSLAKRGKWKLEAGTDSIDMEASEPHVTEAGATDGELEIKPQKKPFTLITPTVHTGFSFSIIHLLSAVRMAMITPHPEDSLDVGKHIEKNDGVHKLRDELNKKHEGINGAYSNEGMDVTELEHCGQMNVPSLTVLEIVNRVRSNPGDPCILETQEPLQDLVRGVLKIFSSKTAPLGAKGWKALVFYEKSTKSWAWIGPVSHSTSDHETIEEVTSPEAWGLPHKMLVKLVDAFANWLKSGQETLQQIGSLPAPPATLMQFNLDEKERFRDLRAQKSLTTISPSSEEVRAYFRKEELLRYSVPDRAFAYTAADGRKSIVAPLRRCGGKPTSKARDHFMLKRDRPPHVTILCLVRDAAARLPGSIGTRADVCTLIRDSQYIVEDVSDAQVNQVVSGALDRLHYERDPCVQFDGERKLWVYLHREREEEDFEDDGTSSTKKWKRQKKDASEQFDQGAVSVAYHGTGERIADGSAAGFDLSSDLNVEPSGMEEDNRVELLYNDMGQNVEDNVEATHGADQGTLHRGNPMVWDALGLNPLRENKLLCQENSTNEDFDDDTFGRDRPVGLLSASLL